MDEPLFVGVQAASEVEHVDDLVVRLRFHEGDVVLRARIWREHRQHEWQRYISLKEIVANEAILDDRAHLFLRSNAHQVHALLREAPHQRALRCFFQCVLNAETNHQLLLRCQQFAFRIYDLA